MRFIIMILIAATVAILSRRTLRVNWHVTYPTEDGLSPEGARELARRLATKSRVRAGDLDVNFLPSRAALELFVGGDAFYPRILRDIESATSSVHISEFEFRPGAVADRFVALLKAKLNQGVEVRITLDRLGSAIHWGSNPLFDDLVEAGVQIVTNDAVLPDWDGLLGGEKRLDRQFDEVAHVDHRKLFVVDGRVAWVGSAGIADHFSNGSFHDVFVRLEGDAVSYLQTVFLTSFRFFGGPLPTWPFAFDAFYPPPATPGDTRVTVLHNVPQSGRLATTDAIVDLMDHAERRLDIICPYTADRGMIHRICDAARRGVAVRFVAPAQSNSWATASAFDHYVPELQQAGVAVWLHPVFPHAKVVLADDRVLVGSTNLDSRALYHNWELGVLVEDADFAERVRRELFEVDIARSQPAVAATNGLVRGKNRLLAAMGPVI